MEFKYANVKSSNISKVAWVQDSGMAVEYNSGARYLYEGVEKETYEKFMEAESKGRFMNAEIKGKYPYKKLPEEKQTL